MLPGSVHTGTQAVLEGAAPTPPGDLGDPPTARPRNGVCAGLESPFVSFVWAFLGVGIMLVAWSFATPIGAAPDEPAQIIQASAIVRGQFNEPYHAAGFGPEATVRVPQWAPDVGYAARCFIFGPTVTPARCIDELSNATTTVSADTQFSNYPPLYYLLVGVPSLFLSGTPAVYAMRVTGDLLNAGLVALGISLLLRYYPRRTPLVGVLLALSPMTLFLMAVVNSSGLEIASGFAAWCGGLCVVEHRDVPRPLAAWTALAVAVLVLSRPTSPLDALVIAVVLAFLVGWRGLRARLNSSLRPLWVPVAVAVALAGILLLVEGTPHLAGVAPSHPQSLLANMWTSVRLTGGYLRQCIGNFGWLDTPVPTWVFIVWTSCLALLTAAALFLSVPCRRALPVLALALFVMPAALQGPQLNAVGLYFQGRYLLPVAVGFPLVASTFHWRVRRHWVPPCLTLFLGIVLMSAQVASFDRALHRYETGLGVPATTPVTWLPPGGRLPVLVVFVIGAIVTVALAVVMMTRLADNRSQRGRPGSVGERHGGLAAC